MTGGWVSALHVSDTGRFGKIEKKDVSLICHDRCQPLANTLWCSSEIELGNSFESWAIFFCKYQRNKKYNLSLLCYFSFCSDSFPFSVCAQSSISLASLSNLTEKLWTRWIFYSWFDNPPKNKYFSVHVSYFVQRLNLMWCLRCCLHFFFHLADS